MRRLLLTALVLGFCIGQPLHTVAQDELPMGAVDPTFRPRLDANPQAVIPLEDGKIVIAGTFQQVGARTVAGIMRLNADGTPDPTFNAGGSGTDGAVTHIALQSGGKILAIGVFSAYNGTPVGQIIRLNTDGTLDKTFKNDNALRLDGSAHTSQYQWELQPGKLLVSADDSFYVLGGYNRVNGKQAPLIAHFTAEGVHDESFLPTDQEIYLKSSPYVDAALLLPSGDIYFGGMINGYNGSSLNKKLFHIGADGKYDEAFAKPKFDSGAPRVLAMKGSDTLLVAGSFYKSFGVRTPLLTALHLDGTPIEGFTAYDFTDPTAGEPEDMINGLVVTDRYIFIGGGDLLQPKRSFVYALDRSGATLTTDFDFGEAPNGIVTGLTYDPRGWLYVSGFFTELGGSAASYFTRCRVDETTVGIDTPQSVLPAVRIEVSKGGFTLHNLVGEAHLQLYTPDGILCATYDGVTDGERIACELPAGLYLMVVEQPVGRQLVKVLL